MTDTNLERKILEIIRNDPFATIASISISLNENENNIKEALNNLMTRN